MVRYRADATQTLHQNRHFPIRAAFDELFKATEFNDVQAHLMHLVVIVQQDGDLAVTLDAGNRLDDDPTQAFGMLGGLQLEIVIHIMRPAINRNEPDRGPRSECDRPTDR